MLTRGKGDALFRTRPTGQIMTGTMNLESGFVFGLWPNELREGRRRLLM